MGTTERHLEFEACFNFRDLGGYETTEGRTVRWGSVYRADFLGRLTESDLERAGRLGLRTVIDLRSSGELERHGRYAGEVEFHHLPLFEEGSLPELPEKDESGRRPFGELYLTMATGGQHALGAALRVIAVGEHPVVFHCTAGKDRTGILSALLLAALGVPDDAIAADYELSERAAEPALAWAEANAPALAKELTSYPSWMRRSPAPVMVAFLDKLRDRHGSIEGYLADAGVDAQAVAQLRRRLLEP